MRDSGTGCGELTNNTAATVEMMHLNKTVDVAIIDECQMVCDKQRGWAWTAALVGVPAKEVFAISNTPALEILKMLSKQYPKGISASKKVAR